MTSKMRTHALNALTLIGGPSAKGRRVEFVFQLDIVEVVVGREIGQPIHGCVFECFNMLLGIISNVGALPRPQRSRNLEHVSLMRSIGYLLELVVGGYLELSELLYEAVLVCVVGVARKQVGDAYDHPVVCPTPYIGEGSRTTSS